ncbi:methionine gamma-lyase [Bacillus solimangrovi]|uniref:L-methionine gamma-lyase n=1 Tax=Bacillus solimangrovi TaxID=1305675 RepID=A0A1E5LF53_9BACI|nr:methionine gamma-lyase [Bacillus solimangrovi]OEH92718.1 methionine gamma-lyase [Bacillus solimangrovi]
MNKKTDYMETAIIHSGYDSSKFQGSLNIPLYQTSTFAFDSAEQGAKRFAGEEEGYIYSRLGNPTVTVLEERIARLEGAEKGLAFASGMGAVSAVLFALTKTGDHILCSQGVYGCTFGLLELMKEKYNVDHDYCALATKQEIEQSIRPETACIYIETPINPTMAIIDLETVVEVARKYDIPVVVDNTFCSPYLQRPLELGCDIVLHSATKYLCGHGDVVAGLVVGKASFIDEVRMTTQKDIGAIIGPFDAWLLLRGMKTLPLRMDRHCESAQQIVEKLKQHPKVKSVYYPGDHEHPQHEIAKKQMKQFSGLISFEIEGSVETCQQFMNSLDMIQIAVSLGDAETLIQHPATMTHSVVPEENRKKMGISNQLIRLSVGLENVNDIWADLEGAFSKL